MGNCCRCCSRREDAAAVAFAEPPLTPRQRLLAVFGRHAPLWLKDVDHVIQDYNNDGERALRYYSAVLGPEPTPEEAKQLYATYLTKDDIVLRQRVHDLLLKCDPTRVVELESIMRAYEAEQAGRGEKATASGLIQQLEQRYSGRLARHGGGASSRPRGAGEALPPPLPLRSDEWSARDACSATPPPPPLSPPAPSRLSRRPGRSVVGRAAALGGEGGGDDGDGVLREFDAILARARRADAAALLPYKPPAQLTSAAAGGP
ncbi:uncharacterized protein Tco025E_00993 [Trypanosoma conorhini]|uniref:Uncharacterized protein n=1 Tax=Trypanosoma conorhini TaxID=83891 RepID=A0A3R7LKZ7_9TRYP|nr:uncharacterized protein Tco025E_00993 [Trypanosoma conorhini]RNF26759.1 hypothetical protein Tco025E_00993 [Trypanosoma conorhini]